MRRGTVAGTSTSGGLVKGRADRHSTVAGSTVSTGTVAGIAALSIERRRGGPVAGSTTTTSPAPIPGRRGRALRHLRDEELLLLLT